MVERGTYNAEVEGSIPSAPTIYFLFLVYGRLAQWQSDSFTPSRPGVRSLHRPPFFMLNIQIIYEDGDLLVINKPSGILTHPKSTNDTDPSVIDWLKSDRPEILKVGENSLRPGIVHRLDKETSGLLIIAKNNNSFQYLKNLFQERKIKKTYLALVHGKLKNKEGIIAASLGRIDSRQTTKIHGRHELKEKEAETDYKVAKEYTDYSLIKASPRTGRTHQIRVHLNLIGHPIVCDPLYGGKKKQCPPSLGRLFLHAQSLSFTAPDGKALSLEADLPQDLQSFLSELDKKQPIS